MVKASFIIAQWGLEPELAIYAPGGHPNCSVVYTCKDTRMTTCFAVSNSNSCLIEIRDINGIG